MGFGKLRKCLGSCAKEGNFELHRFASKINNNIIGGASKLLSYFEKTFMPDVIISYSKRDYSDGNLYEKLGFRLDKICDPGFYWIVDGVRKHRFSYRKNNILKNANDDRSGIQINNHATVKPVKLMSYLITLGSQKGDIILDPFLGSGTTAIAAVLTDRKYLGMEINKEYYDIAIQRLKFHEKKQNKLDQRNHYARMI